MFNKYIPDLDKYIEDNKYSMAQCKIGLRWLLEKFQEKKPKVYLEIGAAALYTFGAHESFLPNKQDDGLAIGIDIHPNRSDWWNYKSFSGCDTLLIHGSSTQTSTYEQVISKLNSRTIDWLFIDGSHYYKDVSREWELYSPLVTKTNSMIVFHDCDPEPAKVYIDNPDKDTTGQGAGIMYHKLKTEGYNIKLVPGSLIGTGYIENE